MSVRGNAALAGRKCRPELNGYACLSLDDQSPSQELSRETQTSEGLPTRHRRLFYDVLLNILASSPGR